MEDETLHKNNNLYVFGPFCLDAAERRLSRNGQIIGLRPKAFDLLLILVREAHHVKTREELIQALWPDTIVEEHSLTVNINLLRKLFGEHDQGQQYIETVRGHGYRFIAAVTTGNNVVASDNRSDEPRTAVNGGQTGQPAPAVRKRSPVAPWLVLAVGLIIGCLLAAYFIARPSGVSNENSTAVPSIAVLPFENLSADKTNAYFVRGIQDLILTKLAGIGALKVISRTSTEHYPSHPENLKAIAAQLKVATILEGSVQKKGNRVLINVQLIDAKSGSHIWARAYTRKLDNVFDVESSVAQQIAAALKLRLLPEEAKRLARVPTNNPQAYDFFLRGDYLAAQVERRKAANPAKTAAHAGKLYRRAIAEDPDFALAQARLSILDSYVYWYDLDHTQERIAEARKTAEAALKSGLPQAHLAMGYVYYRGYRDYARALTEFKQTRRMLPNSTEAISAIAFVQRRQGMWQAALNGLRQAEILDPRNPLWHQARGETLVQLRHYAAAQEEFDHAFSVAPQYYLARVYKVSAQFLAGNVLDARRVLNKIPSDANLRGMVYAARFEAGWLNRDPDRALASLDPVDSRLIASLFMVGDTPVSLLKARAWAFMGNKVKARQGYETARRMLSEALRRHPDNPDFLSFLALTEAGLGEKTAAVHSARRATKLLPISKDAFYGPSHLTALAMVFAQLGEAAPAVKRLRRLLEIPAGLSISVPLLRLDPVWDPIREDPAFQALLKRYRTPRAAPVNASAARIAAQAARR